jgi:serine/threonine protein phosphatase PrpC
VKLRVGARTDIGRSRRINEDGYLVRDPLFAVADGMGGHQGGEVASSLALETLGRLNAGQDGALRALVDEIRRANRDVLEKGGADPALQGMGTTLTVLLTEGEKAHVAHVGDSRAYLLRDGNLQQLTEDHTLVQRMVREGRLTPDEADHHPQRSILTRALGVDEEIPVDELTLPIHSGDRLLLCTDGLTGMIGEKRIQDILEAQRDPQAASDQLVDEANRAGGDDNITVIVVDFGAAEETAAERTEALASVDGDGSETAMPSSAETETAAGARPAGVDVTGFMTPVDGSRERRTRPEPDHEPEDARRRRIPWGRLAAWLGALVLLVALAGLGVRLYINTQWYVGVEEDRIAIYNGIPTQVLGYALSEVEETTEIAAADAMRLQPWRGLDDGITATSLADAQDIVDQIREDVEASP